MSERGERPRALAPQKSKARTMNHTPRIKSLDVSAMDMIQAIAEGNPGALRVSVELFRDATKIDPDSALGAFGPILSFDSYGIYGSRIWQLYKDVCHGDLPRLMAVLRACQLGILPESKMHHAIENRGDGIDTAALLKSVQERLPAFASA